MYNMLLMSAALMVGQITDPSRTSAQILPPLVIRGPEINLVSHGSSAGAASCDTGACNGGSCLITLLKCWTPDSLKMECVEHKPHCDACHGGFLMSLLYCPKEPEPAAANGNGKDEKKNGDAKDEKKNGNGKTEEKKEEESAPDLNVAMQIMKCYCPSLYDHFDHNGVKVYGWIQAGATANFASPRDRLNYGPNFNNRSNDVLLNQLYLVVEKTLDLDKKKDQFHIGGRVDFFIGHDAPYMENLGLGLFDKFTGDRLEAPRNSDVGVALPQFYLDVHTPILTDRGVDFRFGRMYTLMTYELSPATQTLFYSHSYEYFYAMPFTHLCLGMATIHIGDTVDIMNGITRGWDVVFQDNNDSVNYHGAFVWNSCDKSTNVTFAWCTGPEQLQNNHNDRTVLTGYYSKTFGDKNQWKYVGGGGLGWEQNATLDAASAARSAEWYSASNYLFYTVDPRLTLGVRGEWFRDDDGARTAFANSDNGGALWNRPGYAGNFYELTFGASYKPYQNLRVRPELRFDWFNGQAIDGGTSRPFNDQTDRFQTTLGVDFIYEF